MGLIKMCRQTFIAFGVPVELSSDGAPEYSSSEFSIFLERWGVWHPMSSAYFPASNGQEEVAVKQAKRALKNNVNKNGEKTEKNSPELFCTCAIHGAERHANSLPSYFWDDHYEMHS